MLYSQHDPAYDRTLLGPGPMTIHQAGCFLCSIATLYQKSPVTLAQVPGAFTATDDLVAGVLAQFCNGTYSGASQTPIAGWQIAKTDFYLTAYHTFHFFCVNHDTGEMIDPLDFPAHVKPLRQDYKIVEYRQFTNITLDTSVPHSPFPDVPADSPNVQCIEWAQRLGLMHGQEDGLFHPHDPVSREVLAIVLYRFAHHG